MIFDKKLKEELMDLIGPDGVMLYHTQLSPEVSGPQ